MLMCYALFLLQEQCSTSFTIQVNQGTQLLCRSIINTFNVTSGSDLLRLQNILRDTAA